MRLYATVNQMAVKKFKKFVVDQKTGEVSLDLSYMLQGAVMDLDNKLALYQCSFDEGFGIENLAAACKAKASEVDCDAIRDQVEAAAQQLVGQQVELIVKKAKATKGGFLTLVVGSVQALPAVAV